MIKSQRSLFATGGGYSLLGLGSTAFLVTERVRYEYIIKTTSFLPQDLHHYKEYFFELIKRLDDAGSHCNLKIIEKELLL